MALPARRPIWAKAAVAFDVNCNAPALKTQQIVSPDGKILVELRCHASNGPEDPIQYLHITERNGHSQEVNLKEGAEELLWSPDSKAFLVNGGESASAGFFVAVYQIFSSSAMRICKLNLCERRYRC